MKAFIADAYTKDGKPVRGKTRPNGPSASPADRNLFQKMGSVATRRIPLRMAPRHLPDDASTVASRYSGGSVRSTRSVSSSTPPDETSGAGSPTASGQPRDWRDRFRKLNADFKSFRQQLNGATPMFNRFDPAQSVTSGARSHTSGGTSRSLGGMSAASGGTQKTYQHPMSVYSDMDRSYDLLKARGDAGDVEDARSSPYSLTISSSSYRGWNSASTSPTSTLRPEGRWSSRSSGYHGRPYIDRSMTSDTSSEYHTKRYHKVKEGEYHKKKYYKDENYEETSMDEGIDPDIKYYYNNKIRHHRSSQKESPYMRNMKADSTMVYDKGRYLKPTDRRHHHAKGHDHTQSTNSYDRRYNQKKQPSQRTYYNRTDNSGGKNSQDRNKPKRPRDSKQSHGDRSDLNYRGNFSMSGYLKPTHSGHRPSDGVLHTDPSSKHTPRDRSDPSKGPSQTGRSGPDHSRHPPRGRGLASERSHSNNNESFINSNRHYAETRRNPAYNLPHSRREGRETGKPPAGTVTSQTSTNTYQYIDHTHTHRQPDLLNSN